MPLLQLVATFKITTRHMLKVIRREKVVFVRIGFNRKLSNQHCMSNTKKRNFPREIHYRHLSSRVLIFLFHNPHEACETVIYIAILIHVQRVWKLFSGCLCCKFGISCLVLMIAGGEYICIESLPLHLDPSGLVQGASGVP